jgi:predicted Zn-dependent protease
MKTISIIRPAIFILFIAALMGCNNQPAAESQKSDKADVEVKSKTIEKVSTPNLIVVRYENFPESIVDEAKAMLSPYFAKISEVDAVLPDSAYYQPRNRYLSKVLLNQLLSFRQPNSLVLGITKKDISVAIHGYDNFGIMGQSLLNQHVAIASTWRVGKVNNLKRQDFKKLMLHELAHSVGMPHCKTDNCILHDAEKKNRFSSSPSFCDTCKQRLSAKGWANMN